MLKGWGFGLYFFSAIVFAADKADYMQELEFIEFLGSWETNDGELIYPDEIEMMELSETNVEKSRHTTKTKRTNADE